MTSTPKTQADKDQQKKKDKHKRDRFEALVPPRLTKLLIAAKQLKNLANTSNYKYTKGEAEQIAKAVRDIADDIDIAFNDSGEYPLTKITFDQTELD